MKKMMLALACLLFSATAAFAGEIDLPGYGKFTVDDAIISMLSDLGYDGAAIARELEKAGVSQGDFDKYKDDIQSKLDEFSEELSKNETFNEAKGIIGNVKDGFYGFAENLAHAIQDSSTLQNTEAPAWIGYIVPGIHFRLGMDASVATLDIDPLLKMMDSLGFPLDLSSVTKSVQDVPVIGSYDHHLVFPTAAINARVGGFVLPFDAGLSLMVIDTRGNLSAVWPTDLVDIKYFTLGIDGRYRLLQYGPARRNLQVGAQAGVYLTNGGVEASVDEGSAEFSFNQVSASVGVQASGHLFCLDAFVGGKVLTTIASSVDLSARPNWDTILDIDDAEAKKVAVALMPKEIGFTASNGWGGNFGLHPVLYGGIGLDAKVLRMQAAVSYNILSRNLGATVSVRASW